MERDKVLVIDLAGRGVVGRFASSDLPFVIRDDGAALVPDRGFMGPLRWYEPKR